MLLTKAAWVAVVVGGLRWVSLTRRRLGYLVMNLDLEEKTMRKEKPKTGSATDVLGLGFNPNQYNRGRKQEKSTRSVAKRSTRTSQVVPAS
jgi:hypothetical protein